MSLALDLDFLGDFGARVRAMFPLVLLRAYAAVLVGRQAQRAAHGAHREFSLAIGAPRQVAHNDSKERALLVYVDVETPLLVLIGVTYSSSIDSGSSSFGLARKQGTGALPAMFVLLPGDQLFARANVVPVTAIVAQEWY